jgi:hypothetical protein
MKRTLSALLVVSLLMPPVVPAMAQSVAGIAIASMDRASVRPFDRLVITGSGFQPASAAISVLFVPKQHGVPVVIPVYSATATRLEVIVPAFLDPAAGDFGFGQADVQVVQVTGDHVMSSNVLSGLDVAPVPALPASVGTGKVTRAFMRMSLKFLTAADASASQEARAAFRAFKDEQTALLAVVEGVVANPAVGAAARTVDSAALMIDAEMLKTSDRLIAAYLTSITTLVESQRLGDERAQALADEPCPRDVGDGVLDDVMCRAQIAILAASRNWITGVAVIAAGASVFVALSVAGVAFPALAAGTAGVLVLAGAAQLLYLSVSSTLVTSILSPDGPTVMSMLRDHTRKILEHANETTGLPVTSTAMVAADALTQVASWVRPTPNSSPQGGTTMSAPGLGLGGDVREIVTFQGSGAATRATRYGVPSTQSTRTIVAAVIAPPSLSWFDGAYLGVMNVTAAAGGKQESGTFNISFTVLDGVVKVIDPAAGTGTISANGRLRSSVGNCTITGSLAVGGPGPHGPGGGGGALPLCVNGEYSGWGSWSVSRAPRP